MGIVLRLGKPHRIIKSELNMMIWPIDKPIIMRIDDIPELKTAGTEETCKNIIFDYMKNELIDLSMIK